jgi:hypothetical protein
VQEEPPLGLQSRFRAEAPTHRHVPNFPHRSPIRHSAGLAVVVAQGRLRVLAPVPAHSLAGYPSAGAAAVAAARADTGSGPAPMYDVPVAAADVVDDTADTHSAVDAAAACHIHVGQACWSDNKRSRYLVLEAGQGQWDLCSHAQWHSQPMTTAAAGSCRSRHFLVLAVGMYTMGCGRYFPARMWPAGEVPVEVVEGAGTAARTPADSCCLLLPALPAQAGEAGVHTDYTLQPVYRTAHSIHRRRARKPGHSAVAEGEVDTDRNQ